MKKLLFTFLFCLSFAANAQFSSGQVLSASALNAALDNATKFQQTGNGAVVSTVQKKLQESVSVKDFGAKVDGVTDDTAAIQAAIEAVKAGGGKVLMPAGTAVISAPITLYDGVTLQGAGRKASMLSKATNTLGTKGSTTAPGRSSSDSFNVDALIVLYHNASSYTYGTGIKDLYLKGKGNNTYGIFAPRTSQTIIESVYIEAVQTGYYTNDSWLTSLRKVTAQGVSTGFRFADDGSGKGTGTSAVFDNCWINFDNTVNQPVAGYDIYGLTYSSFISSAADNAIATDNSSPYIYKFVTAQNIAIIGGGAENGKAGVIFAVNSRLNINGFRTIGMTANSAWGTVGTIYNDGSTLVFENAKFEATSPGSGIYNQVIQNGGVQTEIESTMPSGGNTFTSYSGGAQRTIIAGGVTSVINANGATYGVMAATQGSRQDKQNKTVVSAGAPIFAITLASAANQSAVVELSISGNDSSYPNGTVFQRVAFAFTRESGTAYYQASNVLNTTLAGNNFAAAPTFSISRSGDTWTVTMVPGNGDIVCNFVAEVQTPNSQPATFAYQ